MLERLIALLRGRRWRPGVMIFTRGWRPEWRGIAWRVRPARVFYPRRQMGPREERKPRRNS